MRAVSAGTCCDLREHLCTPHNRGLNNKCFDDCMCVEGEGSQGSPVPPRPRNFLSSLKLVLCRVGDAVPCRGWAEGSAGKEAVGESLGSCSPEQEQLRSVPSQSVNAFSPDSWHHLTICFFSPLEIQAGMISQDLEAGEGRREEPIALNKMKPEKAGAFGLSGCPAVRGEALQV